MARKYHSAKSPGLVYPVGQTYQSSPVTMPVNPSAIIKFLFSLNPSPSCDPSIGQLQKCPLFETGPEVCLPALNKFNHGVIVSTAIHEAYPGHYLQGLWLEKAPSKALYFTFTSIPFCHFGPQPHPYLAVASARLTSLVEVRASEREHAVIDDHHFRMHVNHVASIFANAFQPGALVGYGTVQMSPIRKKADGKIFFP